MTIAEQLIQRGREESAEALRKAEIEKQQAVDKIESERHQIALNFLRSGLPIDFVAENTQVAIEQLEQLLQQDQQH